ncbi:MULTISPECIES: ParA family partition ATPase [unclassified Wenzhouxiangella]|uniref:ParA family partition ATPase n=1 Tax=unclassified Wenzhouxiangella TaxID=2613841 RepID=UPI000E32508F|nr:MULTISPECIES: ParA family partition ATPase [unclassified Wenzhouxiangella]RFF27245.1 ParA family protein [Wenzhouxiangella sp. 15181]RFP69227.1 ParA family protein [Wenzhouxiangella sp. 15190]
MAYIVTITNQKGGCGKTTVAMGLAGTLGLRGHKVLVVDADVQATASRWAFAAEEGKPFPATVTGLAAAGSKLHQQVRKYVGDYDYIVIDTPPAVESSAPQSALLISDLAMMPVIPSPPDLWAAQGILRLIQAAQVVNDQLEALLLPNMVPRTVLGREALEALDAFELPVFETGLGQRTAYREASISGVAIQALGRRASQATMELDALSDEVERRAA